jgi:DNA processing protein
MPPDIVYRIALTMVPQVGPVQAKILLQQFEPEAIFRARSSLLEKIDGIGTVRADAIRGFSDFKRVEEEIRFVEKNGINPVFITDRNYPQRLLHCYDSPTLIYCKGNTDLNRPKVIAVIGSRSHTDYGRQITENLVAGLCKEDLLVISGLAFGIDAIAHRAALINKIPTVAVLAHGLDQVYPNDHIPLANQILHEQGTLLTEFRSGEIPDRHNFPSRNRIVAGMSDATIVIETKIKGGSMITAELANGYNRDVFAFPGKTTDPKSSGCNYLIQNNKAILLTGPDDLLEIMGWKEKSAGSSKNETKQRELFIELSAEEKIVFDILKEQESVHIDEIHFKSGLSGSAVAAAILNMELQSVIAALPGKMYRLN